MFTPPPDYGEDYRNKCIGDPLSESLGCDSRIPTPPPFSFFDASEEEEPPSSMRPGAVFRPYSSSENRESVDFFGFFDSHIDVSKTRKFLSAPPAKDIYPTTPLSSSDFETEELFSEVETLIEPFTQTEEQRSKTSRVSKFFSTVKKNRIKQTKKSSPIVDQPRKLKEVCLLVPKNKESTSLLKKQDKGISKWDPIQWKNFLDLFLDITVSAKWGCTGIFNKLKDMPQYKGSHDPLLNPEILKSEQLRNLMVLIRAKKFELEKQSSKTFQVSSSNSWSEDELECLRRIKEVALSIKVSNLSPFIGLIFRKNLETCLKREFNKKKLESFKNTQEVVRKFDEIN